MYQVITTLKPADSAGKDSVTTPFGIRTIRFDAKKGFLLNEKPLKLKGVCCHQDHAGVGTALPDGLQEYRIRKLKEMGCNAYRSSHNPPSPALLDACDRLGMLVMDENRQFSSAPEDLADLESHVRRDRNHPSVILWCIGNEETAIQTQPQARRIARTLVQRIHQLDPSRPVTLATTFWDTNFKPMKRLPLDAPTTSVELDVMGFNYNEDYWEPYHRQAPAHPVVITEASSNYRTRGCYESDPSQCFQAWDPRSRGGAEGQWAQVAKAPWLSGIFLWTGFDYRGEPWPQGWPGINSNFGLMDTCGFPKDNYYFYKAWWTSAPLVHIFPHWNWPDQLGKPVTVGCYANCEEVELLLNGHSLGRKTMEPNGHLEWKDVIYAPGALEARGFNGGQQAASERVETTGAPASVRIAQDFIQPQPGGVMVVNVAIADDAGRIVPTADPLVSFQVEGPARIIGVGNGNPSSHEPDHAPHRRAFNGYCQVILQKAESTGSITLTATAPGLRTGKAVMSGTSTSVER